MSKILPQKKLAFLFAGQNTQYTGMGHRLKTTYPVAQAVFRQASAALNLNFDTLLFEKSEETKLGQTQFAQPAILATSIAYLKVFHERFPQIKPDYVAGHSLGEYSALVACGAFTLADAVALVERRGFFMQEAVPVGQGAMAALASKTPIEYRDVARLLEDPKLLGKTVNLALWNSPKQFVISGDRESVDLAGDIVKAGSFSFRFLPLKNVSAPFHSALMQPVVPRLGEFLDRTAISMLQFPYLPNVHPEPSSSVAHLVPLLKDQVTKTVQWEPTLRKLWDLGVRRFIEFGPKQVQAGFVKETFAGKEDEYRVVSVDSTENPGDITDWNAIDAVINW